MKYFVIAFRDIKANTYLPPICVPNINAAVREIADEVNKPDSQAPWAKWPEDHELWHLGEWDSESGYYDVEHDGSTRDRKQLMLLSALKR